MYIPMWLLILFLVAIVGGCSTRAVATGRMSARQYKRAWTESHVNAPKRKLEAEQSREFWKAKLARDKAASYARAEAGFGDNEWHGG